MQIMQELPKNKLNFPFKNTQDFNQTTHVALQGLLVFIENITLCFICTHFIERVLSWLCHNEGVLELRFYYYRMQFFWGEYISIPLISY